MLVHKQYGINGSGTDYVVGDIHGCYSQLQAELSRVDFNYEVDRLFSVGDLIDRGPESMKCLSLLQQSWFHPVLGNHEKMMIDTVSHGGSNFMWKYNGGMWAEDVLFTELHLYSEYLREYVPITLTIETSKGSVGICHAEPPVKHWGTLATRELSPGRVNTALWDRTVISNSVPVRTTGVVLTVHGHTPVEDIEQTGNAVFIDTGSFLKELDIEGYLGVKVQPIEDLILTEE